MYDWLNNFESIRAVGHEFRNFAIFESNGCGGRSQTLLIYQSTQHRLIVYFRGRKKNLRMFPLVGWSQICVFETRADILG